MTLPIMPKATAVWLVDNTALSFEQIADFCGMHPLEIKGIADGEVATGIIGADPIAAGQLKKEQIENAEEDSKVSLTLAKNAQQYMKKKLKGARYTPVARRADKPDAIAWILKNHPELPDSKTVKLVGTTKNTITAIRERSHWNTNNLRPRDPVLLGLCTQTHLDDAIRKAGGKIDGEDDSDSTAATA
ncbi:MAG: DUF1013 domain-containing protein [Rickettsiales bacterium]|nr:DUF1013 domain-containing protein [Rickettsiales bacterium]